MSLANQKKLVTIVYKKHIFIGVHTHFAISIQTWYDICSDSDVSKFVLIVQNFLKQAFLKSGYPFHLLIAI